MLTQEKTIGDYVAEDYRTAEVFKKYNIDFCCKGGRTIEEAAEKKNIDAGKIYQDLEKIGERTDSSNIDFKSWPLDLLADYVEKTHHRYVEEKSLMIIPYLEKLCKVHGDRHPELFEITKLFKESAGDLAAHMKKEELILFPFIKKMVDAERKGESVERKQFSTVEDPIEAMKDDHSLEGERFEKISELTNGYQIPADGCGTYQVTFKMIEEFANDLHKHIHLENNILFPKAIALEKTLN
ncbi:iron-sulfur cluster repair di-iron protein [Chryseobacterium suipulveris]|uniref:Iron-sulfur cluster repair di-iron protein n=1 Tax=Chryseobacterium suipulveris TaxID=2929800 RepID=A0ABY4BMB1_9FLAO|nr:iron-sulfur cluster repair di-iron protein [Chryseobacterium suipulveris]UOE40310.1 iron-sulfur cluster repair di-iron protein [Chryseobacterium suipulveris]